MAPRRARRATIAGSAPLRILVVAGEPDRRLSTESLCALVDALDGRDDVEVRLWFLRRSETPPWREPDRVVDDLRGGPVGRALAPLPAVVRHLVAGRRLRHWMATVDADAVLLDDGLGDRLLPSASRRPIVVVRHNPEPPPRADLEAPPRTEGDVVLRGEHARTGDHGDGSSVPMPILRRLAAPAPGARSPLREAIGVDPGTPLVVGRGEDPWLDGPDLFVRALWFLEHRHGIEAHGAWLGLGAAGRWREILTLEAERCGVADRFHVLDDAEPGWEEGADVAFLPFRVGAPEVVVACGVAGLPVVTFPPAMLDARWAHEVPVLDVERAASAVAAALAHDHEEVRHQLDADRWAEALVDRLRRTRAR